MAEGITRISVKGFKSLAEECSVEVRPLTILAGANSSGKSSIMQPLLMMKQTLEATYDPGALLLDGPNVRFTAAEQFLSRSKNKVGDGFEVEYDLNGSRSIREYFIRIPGKGMDIAEMTYFDLVNETTTLRPGMGHSDLLSEVTWLSDVWNNFVRIQGDEINEKMEMRSYRFRCFLDIGYFPIKKTEDNNNISPILVKYIPDTFGNSLREIIHISALRGNPQRTYKITAVGPQFPGRFEDYVASIVHEWQDDSDLRLKKLEEYLELLGLTRNVGAKSVDDTQVEILVGRLPVNSAENSNGNEMISIADVGFGISQTLPVLVALLAAKPGQLVYIEQPEIHLHPRAQTAMAQILADMADRGVKVVVETHSSLLLLGIQSLVAQGTLSSKCVKLHWFKRRLDDGVTEVTSADLDDAGAFGDWPEDFSSAEMDADTRYIHAAEARLE
ncbi:MAG: hypothetical protein BWY13_01502 [Euryarchaeota archaeon ADurb.Bin190]|jgi:predicted ATPase|nr:MAG: hypothetical protein BWY13_01502 [Euryarchaeota archaeon ADurb.Bin190]HNQ54984.1 AAA family ATPase [Methanothrix sp.]HNU40768.1 AAA family ATPase [Methanothrix sp.]HPM25903.1 AAA family ATPase [Methanothrix sp.]HQQ37131.1 AAA family ATPase [Methanothrix sp.]